MSINGFSLFDEPRVHVGSQVSSQVSYLQFGWHFRGPVHVYTVDPVDPWVAVGS